MKNTKYKCHSCKNTNYFWKSDSCKNSQINPLGGKCSYCDPLTISFSKTNGLRKLFSYKNWHFSKRKVFRHSNKWKSTFSFKAVWCIFVKVFVLPNSVDNIGSQARFLGPRELWSHAYSSKICVFGARGGSHRSHGSHGIRRSGGKTRCSDPPSHTRRGLGWR